MEDAVKQSSLLGDGAPVAKKEHRVSKRVRSAFGRLNLPDIHFHNYSSYPVSTSLYTSISLRAVLRTPLPICHITDL